jgi:hypothetical protein
MFGESTSGTLATLDVSLVSESTKSQSLLHERDMRRKSTAWRAMSKGKTYDLYNLV